MYGAVFHGDSHQTRGNPGSVIVPQYGSSKITVFVWGKNTILIFVVFLPHTNTVILLELYCGTITEPGLPVTKPGRKILSRT